MAYIGSAPTTTASRKSQTTYRYLCTAGLTVISGADLNNNVLSCDPLDTEVFMNGLKLDSTDTTITPTQVTLAVPAAAGDEIEVVAFRTFETADHYTKSDADTRYVNASGDTMSGGLNVTGGNVGIGTSSPTGVPTTTLHINGTTNAGIHITDSASGATDSDGVYLSMDNPNLYIQNKEAGFTSFETSGTERMKIDSSGRVTKPYQPAFNAYLTSNTAQSSAINLVAGTFATSFNIGTHYSTSTKRFTAPVAGRYLFTGTVSTIGGQGSFSYLSCEFWVNGSRTHIGGWAGNSSPSYSNTVSATVLSLSVNDYVQLACETNKAFTMQGGVSNYTFFNGYLLG